MKVKFRVPASTSNFGSGFDTFGAALSLYNEFSAETVSDKNLSGIFIEGEAKGKLPLDEKNLVWQMMSRTFKKLNCKKFNLNNLKITIKSKVPLGSGLGSSATAIVGAIALANYLCGDKMSKEDIAQTASDIEGHPDNAFPAVMGGLCLCYGVKDKISFIKLPVSNLKLIVINPSFEVSTDKARKQLPKKYPTKDIVFNISRAALLSAAFAGEKYDLLENAFEDKIHQPYRSKNIPFMDEVFAAALKSGAFGAFISGSGPSLAAVSNPKKAAAICNAMSAVWEKRKIETKSFILNFDKDGLKRI